MTALHHLPIAFALAICASLAWSQEQELNKDVPSLTPIEIDKGIITWEALPKNLSTGEIQKIIDESGWNSKILDLPYDRNLKLYKHNIAPGVNNFLILPENGEPIQLSSGFEIKPSQVHQVFWGDRISSDRIRDEIIRGMNAAIDALCGMRSRPSIIRAKASAFGVVEVEATWNSENVCE